ncbi:MAG: hypothetical protein R3F17_17175, partial [Planctomycetota bacterium]
MPRPLDYGDQMKHCSGSENRRGDRILGRERAFALPDDWTGEQPAKGRSGPAVGDGSALHGGAVTAWLRAVRESTRCGQQGAAARILLRPATAARPPATGHPWSQNRRHVRTHRGALQRIADQWSVALAGEFEDTLDEGTVAPGLHRSDSVLAAYAHSAPWCASRSATPPDSLVQACRDKARQWYYRYRAVNGYYIYGGRKDPFGVHSFPGEMARLDDITAWHDRCIWALAMGEEAPAADPTQWTVLPEIPSNFERPIAVLDPEAQKATFTLAEGWRAELFAGEDRFPELENPVALTFDSRGRLWVSVMPGYPQVLPGTPVDDKLLIFPDENRDGRADRCQVFARGLHLPAGFELGHGVAYVAQMPNLVALADTDGDDVADKSEVLLRGFGTEDSHHAISAFTWDPAGGFYCQEGTFHHSQVETPWGPLRVHDGAVFRYDPRRSRLSVHTPWGFYNPWGHVFDGWGRDLIGDASDGGNYLAAPMQTRTRYDRVRRGLPSFTRNQVRPTGGSEILQGPGVPAEVQGDYLISNTIGFQGIRAHRLRADGSGVYADESWDLL